MIQIIDLKRKICLIGDWGVGKTSLVRRFVLDQYEDKYLATLGTKIYKKRIKFKISDDRLIDMNLMIWDVMGQKEFKRAQRMAFSGTQAAFIVCDVTRRDTFFSIGLWLAELSSVASNIPVFVLANKIDLKADAQIIIKDLKEVTNDLNTPSFFTSAKTGENVEKAFMEMGKKLF
ncbi:Rab family GTPase [[Eubacterium] cellulosolvens]